MSPKASVIDTFGPDPLGVQTRILAGLLPLGLGSRQIWPQYRSGYESDEVDVVWRSRCERNLWLGVDDLERMF